MFFRINDRDVHKRILRRMRATERMLMETRLHDSRRMEEKYDGKKEFNNIKSFEIDFEWT